LKVLSTGDKTEIAGDLYASTAVPATEDGNRLRVIRVNLLRFLVAQPKSGALESAIMDDVKRK
jgi:hypothetical protein